MCEAWNIENGSSVKCGWEITLQILRATVTLIFKHND